MPADKTLHRALTGVSNARTLGNFERAGAISHRRPVPSLLIASTFLMPGYIDAGEVKHIARFIASINPDIPYSLLAFQPDFYMADLPHPSNSLAHQCVRAACLEGLPRVHLGNVYLLV